MRSGSVNRVWSLIGTAGVFRSIRAAAARIFVFAVCGGSEPMPMRRSHVRAAGTASTSAAAVTRDAKTASKINASFIFYPHKSA